MGYRLKQPVSARRIADMLGLAYRGDDCEVEGVAPLSEAAEGELTFSIDALPLARKGVVVIADTTRLEGQERVLHSVTPRLDFIRALDRLDRDTGFEVSNTKPIIHPTVQLGQGCVIEDDVEIGAYSRIGHNAVIMRGTRIGEHCWIRSSAVIGDEGFGFERDMGGRPLRFVHLGGVRIGDHVEIGNATMVCRGTLGDTVIRDYVKIDNLVHVAHNVHIEENAMIIACAEVSGAVRVGRDTWIGPNACVIQKVTLGAGSLVGIGAVVLRDVEPGAVVVGNPAKPLAKKG
jgi:UDP-3-O-[3-hydroxymyristoyl] glucosamine N-acyltransferase